MKIGYLKSAEERLKCPEHGPLNIKKEGTPYVILAENTGSYEGSCPQCGFAFGKLETHVSTGGLVPAVDLILKEIPNETGAES